MAGEFMRLLGLSIHLALMASRIVPLRPSALQHLPLLLLVAAAANLREPGGMAERRFYAIQDDVNLAICNATHHLPRG
jgi:hypothetical protein